MRMIIDHKSSPPISPKRKAPTEGEHPLPSQNCKTECQKYDNLLMTLPFYITIIHVTRLLTT